MPTSFAAARKAAEDAGMLGSGDYYKYREGDNKIRLMSMCLPHPGEYKGTKTFKWLCYVLDRRDGKVKVHFMPHTVYKAIEAFQENPEYTFSDMPMPYDVNIRARGAGTKDVEYTVMPARKETPLTADEESDLDQQKPLSELQAALKEKKATARPDNDPPPHGDEDSTPF